jgi:hypothetical protein
MRENREGRVGSLPSGSDGVGQRAEYHLLLARDLALLDESEYRALGSQVVEIKRMLSAFIGKLRE